MVNLQYSLSDFDNDCKNILLKQIDDILNKSYIYRLKIKGNFEQKVEPMKRVTENLIK